MAVKIPEDAAGTPLEDTVRPQETISPLVLMAVEWWKTGEIDKIIQYCKQDVEVTRDIFEYGRKNGHVKLRRAEGANVEVKVNWN